MVIGMCRCNWGIYGVEALPSHMHVPPLIVYERLEDGYLLRVSNMQGFPAGGNPEFERSGKWRFVRDEDESIRFSVDWKGLARELTTAEAQVL